PKRATTGPRGGRCNGLGAGSGQHVLRTAYASSLAKTAALAALAEVGGCRRSGSPVCVVADRANLPAVIEAAPEQTRIGLVLADAEFDSERNHTYIRQQLGAHSVIPAKRRKK